MHPRFRPLTPKSGVLHVHMSVGGTSSIASGRWRRLREGVEVFVC